MDNPKEIRFVIVETCGDCRGLECEYRAISPNQPPHATKCKLPKSDEYVEKEILPQVGKFNLRVFVKGRGDESNS